MRIALTSLLALAVFASCQSSGVETTTSPDVAAEPDSPTNVGLREPYTRCFEIHVGGTPVGYLLTYDPVPLYAEVERSLPVGTHRIRSLEFAEVGFITPEGEVWRYEGNDSVSLGTHELHVGLSNFFGDGWPVNLTPLQPIEAATSRID